MNDSTSRRTILQTMLAALALPAADSAAEIPTEVMPLAKGKLMSQPFGDQRVFFEGATAQLKSMAVGNVALKAGAAPHPPHQHPEEEVLLITEGHGEIFLEGKKTAVKTGDLMYCAANRLHGITASAAAPMTFYYFKWLGK
jgi:quercetin dioxygenase-like cupin family protein